MSDDRYEYRFVDERDCWFDMEQGRYMSPGDITILLNTHPYFVRRLASLQAEVEEAYIRGALDYCRKESLVREDVDVPDDLLSKEGKPNGNVD